MLGVKLLLLLAVLLMPLGMTPAAANASHHEMASMPMSHCPDQGARHDMKGGIAECTMVCAAALPAVECASDQPSMSIVLPAAAAPAHRLHGLHPEIDLPPPRQS